MDFKQIQILHFFENYFLRLKFFFFEIKDMLQNIRFAFKSTFFLKKFSYQTSTFLKPMVSNLFHPAHLSTQGNLTTHLDQQNLISVAKLLISKKKVFIWNLSAISQFRPKNIKKVLAWNLFPIF